MKGDPIKATVLSIQEIPNADEALLEALNVARPYRSLGILTTDIDDISYAAVDEALKAADVSMKVFYGPPTETNFAGGLLTGSQAACKAACGAFAQAVERIAEAPMKL